MVRQGGLDASALAQIRPLEEAYKFGAFFSSLLNESDFHAKPSVLLLGQYSTGVPRLGCHGLEREVHGVRWLHCCPMCVCWWMACDAPPRISQQASSCQDNMAATSNGLLFLN